MTRTRVASTPSWFSALRSSCARSQFAARPSSQSLQDRTQVPWITPAAFLGRLSNWRNAGFLMVAASGEMPSRRAISVPSFDRSLRNAAATSWMHLYTESGISSPPSHGISDLPR